MKINLKQAGSDPRIRRNVLLTASDWTQLLDVPVATQKRWVSYRKALRDMDFTGHITWPVPPNN